MLGTGKEAFFWSGRRVSGWVFLIDIRPRNALDVDGIGFDAWLHLPTGNQQPRIFTISGILSLSQDVVIPVHSPLMYPSRSHVYYQNIMAWCVGLQVARLVTRAECVLNYQSTIPSYLLAVKDPLVFNLFNHNFTSFLQGNRHPSHQLERHGRPLLLKKLSNMPRFSQISMFSFLMLLVLMASLTIFVDANVRFTWKAAKELQEGDRVTPQIRLEKITPHYYVLVNLGEKPKKFLAKDSATSEPQDYKISHGPPNIEPHIGNRVKVTSRKNLLFRHEEPIKKDS
ncbi:hypothetical protein CROQUDRAFT_97264 [Cronartium quercuum f. sp. fusiforme G11]|uniref:Uncharacterized protein n=1 Tax=Cronartium quercuum f. sp. fusiforme G11 TaxID=708437 RepID=A0A9P6T8K8_9BASI|nr:hypothetical protein CROQUDRAFT_97264 [Cronartium quercuum f. sp. fusiforme G11]